MKKNSNKRTRFLLYILLALLSLFPINEILIHYDMYKTAPSRQTAVLLYIIEKELLEYSKNNKLPRNQNEFDTWFKEHIFIGRDRRIIKPILYSISVSPEVDVLQKPFYVWSVGENGRNDYGKGDDIAIWQSKIRSKNKEFK